jgi:hypothetical protein
MKSYTYPSIITALLIILFYSVDRCQGFRQAAETNLTTLSDSVHYYRNRLGTQTASIKILEVEQSDLKKVVLSKDEQLAALSKEFSRIKTIVQYTQQITYDTIAVTYKDTAPCIFTRSGTVNTKWYGFQYESTNNGFVIDSLTLNNKVTIISGFKRSWLLGRQTLVTDVTNSNPHIQITGLKSTEVVVPSPWYKKWYVWLGAGVIGTLLAR